MSELARQIRRVTLPTLLLALLLPACAVPPQPVEARAPDRRVPEVYAGSNAASTTTENSADIDWTEFFDAPLRALIETALQNNQELNMLALEVGISENEVRARRGEVLPQLGVGVGAGIEKVGEHTSQGAADEANDVPEHLKDYMAGFLATWEVDIWNKLRNATKAATFRYLASIEGRRFATTRLVAEIAHAYYELLALDGQLEVLVENIRIQNDALEVVRLQKQAARVTELAVQRFEAEVLKNQSKRFSIQQQILETENRINLLLGRFPQHIERASDGFLQIRPREVRNGLPTELLENRPDVREAEFELAAAELDVDVARAHFYPSLEIGAGVGYQAYTLGHLKESPESLFYGVSAELFTPLLNRNSIEAHYFSAGAMQMQAVYAYERTILGAYNEVATQLAMIENLDQSFALRERQVERLNDSIETSAGLFTSARADYMEVLLTRREALDAQMELIETKQERLSATVSLYRALGGGWSENTAEQEAQPEHPSEVAQS
ncbi:MAG: RND transporter [Planctomycetota bacterium]|nr:MAG: RND transporter [Planctomycetota bacterium]